MEKNSHDIAPVSGLDGVSIVCVATVPFFVVTQLGGQIRALLDAGMHVTVVTSPGEDLARLPVHKNLDIRTVTIRRDIAPAEDIAAVLALVRLFREVCPRIVHSTTPKAGLLAALAAKVAKVPVRLHTFTGQPWVGLRGVKRWAARTSDRVIGYLNTRCYADSPSQCEFLVEQRVLSRRCVSSLGAGSLAGVDLERFSTTRVGSGVREEIRRELQIAPDTLVFLFVGRLTRDKGIRELLAATRQLHSEGLDVCLVLVGPMDDEAGGRSTIRPAELQGAPYIRYRGYTDCPERYYRTADIFCLPSYREGFGTSVIEAAAMSLPTVGSRIVGLVDAVVDGETGLLVEPGSSGELAKALRRLSESPAFRKELGMRAKERVEKLFSAERVAFLLMEEYKRLLRGTD